MLDVEVPRVPAERIVVVLLEDVARTAEHLAPRLLVPDRRDHTVVAERDAQLLALERSTATPSNRDRARPSRNRLRASHDLSELGLGVRVDPVDARAWEDVV